MDSSEGGKPCLPPTRLYKHKDKREWRAGGRKTGNWTPVANLTKIQNLLLFTLLFKALAKIKQHRDTSDKHFSSQPCQSHIKTRLSLTNVPRQDMTSYLWFPWWNTHRLTHYPIHTADRTHSVSTKQTLRSWPVCLRCATSPQTSVNPI